MAALTAMRASFVAALLAVALLPWGAHSFIIAAPARSSSVLFQLPTANEGDVAAMRVREIKTELTERGVSFSDCFDKESLVQRLQAARVGSVGGTTVKEEEEEEDQVEAKQEPAATEEPVTIETETEAEAEPVANDKRSAGPSEPSNADVAAAAAAAPATDFSAMRVRELREECARRGIRWGTFVEKSDFVRALVEDEALVAGFSPSGKLRPGKVADITGDVLEKELMTATGSGPASLLVLDVYATWCGPCQLMAPQLEQAAAEWKRQVRVAKMDSDKNPEWASKLRVQGLPTVLVFKDGEEVERKEGALMKDALLKLVEKHSG